MRFLLRRDKEVDFDFKHFDRIKRLGRARPAGAGCPPDYDFDFDFGRDALHIMIILTFSAAPIILCI